LPVFFEQAIADLRAAGAILVEIEFEPPREMYRDEFEVLLYELRRDMNSYLSSLPGENLPSSLEAIVAFNKANANEELRWFDQDLFELALTKTDEQAYRAARQNSRRLAREEGIDRLLREYDVRFLLAPTTGPAWASDLVNGDNYPGGIGAGSLAAIAGYPHLTVPMGQVESLPVGLSIIGSAWDDHAVLKAGAAYERARTATTFPPGLRPWMSKSDE